MKRMTEAERDTFLGERRYGILTTNGADGTPVPIPVWFEWDGERARLFSAAGTAKLRRVQADARVALLAPNNPDERERWVLIKGTARVLESGGWELAQRLAARYWDLDDREHAETLRSWEAMASDWVVVEITPGEIVTYAGD